jgi:hypothetical protein
MAANEVQAEHNHKAVLMRPAIPMPSSMTVSSATPGAAEGMAATLSGAYGYQIQPAVAGQAAVVAPPASAAAAMVGAPMLAAAGGVAFGGGSSFVPDTVQSTPGFVQGTVYIPE